MPSSTPSYNRWASPIVRFTLKRILRAASCCKVEVMNGGTGLRRFSFVPTDRTRYSLPSRACTTDCEPASSVIDRFSLLRLTTAVFRTGAFFAFRWTSIDQYSWRAKALISRSRSTIRRQRHSLDAACREPAADFVPQQRGDLVTDQPVEDPARLLGVHERHIHLARTLKRPLYGRGGNFVEGHPEELRTAGPSSNAAPLRGGSRSPLLRGQDRLRGRRRRSLWRRASARR